MAQPIKEVGDTLAWHITLLIAYALVWFILGGLMSVLIYFSITDGFLVWQVAIILFLLTLGLVGITISIVFRIIKIRNTKIGG